MFARRLKQVPFPADFLQSLNALSEDLMQDFFSQIPLGWRTDDLPKIESHLALLREHAAEFAEEVTRRLA